MFKIAWIPLFSLIKLCLYLSIKTIMYEKLFTIFGALKFIVLVGLIIYLSTMTKTDDILTWTPYFVLLAIMPFFLISSLIYQIRNRKVLMLVCFSIMVALDIALLVLLFVLPLDFIDMSKNINVSFLVVSFCASCLMGISKLFTPPDSIIA